MMGSAGTFGAAAAAIARGDAQPFELIATLPPALPGIEPRIAIFPNQIFVFKQDDPLKLRRAIQLAILLADDTCLAARAASQIPARTTCGGLGLFEDNPEFAVIEGFLATQPLGNIGNASPAYSDIRQLYWPQVQAVLAGQKTAQQAMDDFTRAANELLAEVLGE
ncbi:MAG: hypothetical protein HY335_09050 [Deinococcus sp.]|nr:hypothetical protein [Deinococcus sp.]